MSDRLLRLEEKALLTVEVVGKLSGFPPLALAHIPKCLQVFPEIPFGKPGICAKKSINKVLDYDSDGIDLYTFLNLNR